MADVGRPTQYTPDLLKRARGYLTAFKDMGDVVPSIAGLACVLGVTRETCYAWQSDPAKAEFSDILRELMQRQERALINGGLGGDFNPPLTKMMLSKHGYSDRVETDVTSSDGSMTPKPALDVSKLSVEALAEIMLAADDTRSSND
ncbi:MAG: terminase small subunit [Cypionkella sp.]|nr:terminase small subunit [Cypionkella sp.]